MQTLIEVLYYALLFLGAALIGLVGMYAFAKWRVHRILTTMERRKAGPPPVPPKFQSCVRCGAVSIPYEDVCPECYLRAHAFRPTPDMFTESDVHDVIHKQ